FDPGHPEVQKHTFNVCMDIITNYNVDGLNFDYIRYSSADEGYNPVTVARFNQRFGRTGRPLPTDPVWKQFRRDQITGLLRKIYLNAIALRPDVKISCDTITWAPGPANLQAWYSSSAAWNNILQDWRGWMEEGIMDLNIPMAYFNQAGAYTTSWTNWNNFTKDMQYGRHAAIGPGIYLNSIADAITQMRHTRTASPLGNRAVGVCGYDYNTPFSGGGGQFATFHSYLTNSPNAFDPVAGGLFPQPVPVPVMPWKTTPAKGHIKGTIYGGDLTNSLDGAVITLAGPASRMQTNDATGFYGFVDLAPGAYTVTASFPGYPDQTGNIQVSAGTVSTLDLVLSISGPPIITAHPQSLTVIQGATTTFEVSASGSTPLMFQWRLNGANISGATQSSYTRNNVQAADAGEYSAAVSNAVGFAISSNALLEVIIPPSISLQPQSQSIGQGSNVTFTVSAEGTAPLTYLWRLNQVNIPGATAPGYTITNPQPAHAGSYSVAISNAAGWAISSEAVLSVSANPTPPWITVEPAGQAAAAGQPVTFSFTANGQLPFSCQWQFNGTPIPGATNPVLNLPQATPSQSGGYQVIITNAFGAVTSRIAALSVLPFLHTTDLTPLWVLPPLSRPYLTVASLPTERGMAYNPATHRVLVVNRITPRVYVLDAESGDDLHELNMAGVTGGTYPLLMIGVADDGAVYAGNLTTDGATTAFKLYRWANDDPGTAPTVVFSGDPSPGNNQRWGDTLDVRRAGSATQVLLGSRSGTNVAIFTTANGAFTPTEIKVPSAPAGAWGLGIAFGQGDTFWAKATGTALRQFGFNLNTGLGTLLRTHGDAEIPNSVGPIGVSTVFNLLAGIHVASANHLRLFDLSAQDGTLPFVSSMPFPSDNDNSGTGTGAVDFGQDRVYALDANNGLMALQLGFPIPPQMPVAFNPLQVMANGMVRLNWTGTPGFTYVVQSSTDLLDWRDVAAVPSPTGLYEHFELAANGIQFYRVRN
ncbi:MAG TPA: DUF4623 domain-containing protein, partial [Clostridia bacterium]|nr:DUF4623 domain-containing protein [Clostridia bacterium]